MSRIQPRLWCPALTGSLIALAACTPLPTGPSAHMSAPEASPVALDAATSAAAPSAPDANVVPETVVFSGGWAVAPDVAHLAAPAVDPAGRRGVAVYRTTGAARGSIERFFAVGEVRAEGWSDPSHVLAVDRAAGTIWSLDVEHGATARFDGSFLVASADMSVVVALDRASEPVLIDPVTLAQRARVERSLGKGAQVRLGAGGRMLLLSDESQSLVATLDGEVKLEVAVGSWEEDRTSLSPRGRFLGRLVTSEAGAALAVYEVATGKRLYTAPATLFPGSIAFAQDESFALVSNQPDEAVRVELPSGKTRTLRSRQRWETVAYSYVTGSLGITRDGNYACGHPVTSIGKYTNCNDEVLFDLRGGGMPKAAHVSCYVEGNGLATLVKLPKSTFGAGREPIGNMSATYTRLCNSSISRDRTRIGLAVFQPPRDPAATHYEQVELLVIRTADASVERVFELGPGPNGMGALLWHAFSPSGRFVHVEWGETSADYDLTTGDPSPLGALLEEPTDPFRVPGQGEQRLVSVDGGPPFSLR